MSFIKLFASDELGSVDQLKPSARLKREKNSNS
jgi:hypothetical protein